MKNWNYDELVEAKNEDLNDFENDTDYNYSYEAVAGRTLYESTTTIKEGYTESVIVHTIVGKYIIEKCSIEFVLDNKSIFLKILSSYDRNNLDGSLTDEEIFDLEKNITYVVEEFKNRVNC